MSSIFGVKYKDRYISLYSKYEYVVLSHSVRDLFLSYNLIKEVIDNLGIDSENLKFVPSSTVYE